MKKLWTLLVCCCLLMPLSAATKRSAKKPVSSAKTVKRGTTKPTAKKPATRRKPTSARARRSSPPRQTAPTPERYMEIQRALSEKGYYDGAIDGQWNAECVAALKKFQQDQNLAPDGKLGALSLIALGLGPKRDALPSELTGKPEPQSSPE